MVQLKVDELREALEGPGVRASLDPRRRDSEQGDFIVGMLRQFLRGLISIPGCLSSDSASAMRASVWRKPSKISLGGACGRIGIVTSHRACVCE
jgi:hypothetical protein